MVDSSKTELARIEQRLSGNASELWTNAATFDVFFRAPATRDVRLLVLAAASGVDLALKNRDLIGWI